MDSNNTQIKELLHTIESLKQENKILTLQNSILMKHILEIEDNNNVAPPAKVKRNLLKDEEEIDPPFQIASSPPRDNSSFFSTTAVTVDDNIQQKFQIKSEPRMPDPFSGQQDFITLESKPPRLPDPTRQCV